MTEIQPEKVTTDGHDSYPRAIREELGDATEHQTARDLNNLCYGQQLKHLDHSFWVSRQVLFP